MEKDIREEIAETLERMLIDKIDPESINKASNCLLLVLNNYEIQPRCTELVTRESNNPQLIKLYLNECRLNGQREGSRNAYELELNRFDRFVNKSFLQVSTIDIKMYLAQFMIKNNKNRTTDKTRSYLSSFFKFLYHNGFISGNPIEPIKTIKYKKTKEDPFDEVEMSMMRDNIKDVRNRAIIEFLYATGIRVSELCNMKKDDVNASERIVRVIDGKGGKDRKIFITKTALNYLDVYLKTRTDTSELLFINKRGKPLNGHAVRAFMKKYESITGVQNIHPHRFRHTFASVHAANGMPIQNIQLLLGHVNIATTTEYVSVSTEQLKAQFFQTA